MSLNIIIFFFFLNLLGPKILRKQYALYLILSRKKLMYVNFIFFILHFFFNTIAIIQLHN